MLGCEGFREWRYYGQVTKYKEWRYRYSGECIRAAPVKRGLLSCIQIGATRERRGMVSRLRLGGERRYEIGKTKVVRLVV